MKQRGEQPTRIWVAGCSTGLEAYSLAISFLEFAEQSDHPRELKLFGTDADKALVERARAGFYTKDTLEGCPEGWLRRFFVEEAGGYRVARSLRERLVFARQDLIEDPPLPRIDLIWCRSLPTSRETTLRRAVLPKLRYALKPNGFLFLGQSASFELGTDFFQAINRRHGLFCRAPEAGPSFHFVKPPSAPRHRQAQSETQHALALPVDSEPILPATTDKPGEETPFSWVDPSRRTAKLERELAETRARFQAIKREFETLKKTFQAHQEELGVANEELRSTHEDLEYSKAELEVSRKGLEAANRDLVRRNAELASLNNDLNNLHAALPLAIVLLGQDLTVRRFTPAAQVPFGLDSTAIGGALRHLQHNLDFPELEQFVAEVLETATVREREVRDRQGRWYSLRARPYLTADKTIDGAVLVLVDIDALKRTQGQLETQSAKLRETVGELEHFSYSITHDMRAPLRAMRGYAELLLSRFVSALPAEGQQYLQCIATAAERMDQLILDALDYSKAVRQELPVTPLDPEALLRGMLGSYPAFQPPRAQVRISGPFPRVLANQAGLTQCFSNLLNNAVKFVQPGKVPQVKVWAEVRGGAESKGEAPACVRIWFEDNGIGIPPECKERIFDMFQRLSRDYEGTGIGLALVRKAAERMGGRVGVESAPDGGSRFWLDLRAAG